MITSCVECVSPVPADFNVFATVIVTVPESPAITVPGDMTTLPLTTASEGWVERGVRRRDQYEKEHHEDA